MNAKEQARRDKWNGSQPVYWFACLEIARDQGDREREKLANEHLLRLGVKVTYDKVCPTCKRKR